MQQTIYYNILERSFEEKEVVCILNNSGCQLSALHLVLKRGRIVRFDFYTIVKVLWEMYTVNVFTEMYIVCIQIVPE